MNISFSKTIPACRSYSKLTTRRIGSWNLKPAQVIQQIEKGQGIPKGEHVVPIHKIQVISTRAERLDTLITMPEYGRLEMIREGFPNWTPEEFVIMFCNMNKCKPETIVNRIDFRYYLKPTQGLILAVPESIAECPVCSQDFEISPDGYKLDSDGTMYCDSYGLVSHTMPFTSWQTVREPIDTWLMDTFRFEIGGGQ